nr:MAG TPA: hypothetical protein [Caudoviricetes sp.]
MNLFYEAYPGTVEINGSEYEILTDFRDYISFLDMIKDDSVSLGEKQMLIMEYFTEEKPDDFQCAVESLCDFINMQGIPVCGPGDGCEEEGQETRARKDLYSFAADYPCILSGFLHDYGIDLQTVEHLHWWKFRMLFDNLSDSTEIKQRIYYRAKDLGTIKDKEERKRIAEIQRLIRLPEEKISDYEIGDAFDF